MMMIIILLLIIIIINQNTKHFTRIKVVLRAYVINFVLGASANTCTVNSRYLDFVYLE